MTWLVMIDCHDLGQHLASYGWQAVPSDNLDSIADAGVRFANSFCTAPQCSPSRAGLYTGRYAHANGMFGLAHSPFDWRLYPGEQHLARLLKDAGWHTMQIGVQHVTGHDVDSVRALGFDSVQVLADPEAIAAAAVEALSMADTQQPFFLNIGFHEPHRDAAGGFGQAPPDESRGVSLPPYVPPTAESQTEFAQLQGVIRRLDAAVGTIWHALQAQGHLTETWLIFTTDHGIAMPRAKTTLYDPGIETALLMVGQPFNFGMGRVQHELVSNVDLVPTILEGLGIRPPPNLHGRSFWGLLCGTDYQPRSEVFAGKTFHTAYEPQRAVRTARYKLIWNAEVDVVNVAADIQHSPIFPQMIDSFTRERPPVELYNLETDPNELHNLAGLSAYTEIERDLLRTLRAWMQATDDPLLTGPIASPYYVRAIRRLLEKDDAT